MRGLLRLVVLLVVPTVASLPVAAQLTVVGIPTDSFNKVYATQRNSEWCWAASIQMILNYYGINIAQEDCQTIVWSIGPPGRFAELGGQSPRDYRESKQLER